MVKSKVANRALSIFTGRLGLFALIAALAAAVTIYYGPIQSWFSDRSYRHEVLQELQNARDTLAYTLVCRKRHWRRPARFNLLHMNKVPQLFSGDLELRETVRFLYESLHSGMSEAAELRHLLAQEDADRVLVRNLERSIEKIVRLADEVGPRIAAFVGGTWRTPPPGLTPEELIRYYEGIVISAATDEYVTY